MSDEDNVVAKLYSAFRDGDVEGMAACYHENVTFRDEAFTLTGKDETVAMWRMLLRKAKGNLKVEFSNVKESQEGGEDWVQMEADWEAWYKYGKRDVHNIIHARFALQDGLVIRHVDTFDFYRWSKMALGPVGYVLGWTPFFQNKVRATAMAGLQSFRDKESAMLAADVAQE